LKCPLFTKKTNGRVDMLLTGVLETCAEIASWKRDIVLNVAGYFGKLPVHSKP
jgi:hypothetical protein